MRESVQKQVERIIDQGDGDRRLVIVCVANSGGATLADGVVDALSRRRLILSARDVMPCPGQPGQAGGAMATDSESLFVNSTNGGQRGAGRGPQANSTLGVVESSALRAAMVAELRAAGMRELAPFLSSEVVQRCLREAQDNSGRELSEEDISFWHARSVLLNISRADLSRLSNSSLGVTSVSPNLPVPSPQLVQVRNVPREITRGAASSWGIQKINALAVWGVYGVRGKGVTVGTLDSGVDTRHDDLRGKVSAWAEFDKNGLMVTGSTPHDSGRHGTICAGNIVGGNHSGQWIGVAPEASLAAALVLNGSDGGSYAQVLAGMQWAIEQQVDVLNMSLGKFVAGPDTPPCFAVAIDNCLQAGILPVIAIGNEGEQTSDTPGSDLFAFATGSTDYRDEPSGFSGGRTQVIRESPILDPKFLPFIYQKPDVCAPGVAIKTSVPVNPGELWGFFSGTSLAATHVSGAIALLLGATNIREKVFGRDRAYLIHDLLTSSVEELGESGQDSRFGFGRIDVLRAIGLAYECNYRPSGTAAPRDSNY